MSENSTATKTAAVIFCCCCSASRMRHCKMWQEKTEATAAGFQDCPRETKIHRGWCLLLWVELLLPSRQEGVFWRTNNATLKTRTMPMAPAATLSTERQLAWSQGHHSVQQQRVMVKLMPWCCGGWKSKHGWCTNAYMTYSIVGRADFVFNQFYKPYGYILQNIEVTALQEICYVPQFHHRASFSA